jgi:hypothetical protein
MAGVDPAIHVLAADKDVDARAKPAHDAAEALRDLARMKGWGGDALQIPLRFPVNIIRVTPASMPANFICLQFAESRVRTNKEQKEGTHRQPMTSPPTTVVTTRFCLSRVSHKVSYNHLATFCANKANGCANKANREKASNIKQFQSLGL